MKKKKENMRVYVLMLSKEFPKDHPKAGQPTRFRCKFLMGRKFSEACTWACTYDGTENTRRSCSRNAIVEDGKSWNSPKIHTIRTNLERWMKIMQKVQEGKALISVRQWKGRPYEKGNVQVEIARLGKDDGVGLQTLSVMEYTDADDGIKRAVYCIDGKPMPMLTLKQIAENDGLTVEDWKAWFTGMTFDKPLPIIHFTSFRYGGQEG